MKLEAGLKGKIRMRIGLIIVRLVFRKFICELKFLLFQNKVKVRKEYMKLGGELSESNINIF